MADKTLDESLESLTQSIDRSIVQRAELRERLRLITRAALERIDGDNQPNDTYWSEIVGIAEGDPDWLRHARINYDVNHERLVQLSTSLVEHVVDQFSRYSLADTPRVAREIADQIEQEILPELMLGEDGRSFRRGQGIPERRADR